LNFVIIGNSAAGIACIEAIRSRDKKSGITVVSEEDYKIYSRCLLSYFLAGAIPEKGLIYRPDSFYKKNGVEALIGTRCERVLADEKAIELGGRKIKFDRLLIATGASPKFPAINGIDKKGVFGLRKISDAKNILKSLKAVKTVAILGGGLIGLKSAYGLSTHGKDIRVIVKSNQVLSQILDKHAAAIFQEWIAKKGITVMTGLEAKEILGKDAVKAVALDDGRTLDCEMVVVGKGVEPNGALAKDAGIKVEEGIVVDESLRTSAEDIYAAGDVAQAKDLLTGESGVNAVWPVAVGEGKVAGSCMAGERTAYDGSMASNSVEFFGLPVISMGITRPKEGFEELIHEDTANHIYKKVVLKGDRAVGMIFVGDIKSAGVIGALIRSRIDVSPVKGLLLEENFDFAKIAGLVKDSRDRFKAEEFKEITLTY
jgi:NAD(P)H-nitrite reductase large subunit